MRRLPYTSPGWLYAYAGALAVYLAIFELFGGLVLLGLVAGGLFLILSSAEALRGYPRGDR